MFSLLPFKNLESDRLLLRQMTTEDVHNFFALRRDPEIMQYIRKSLAKNEEEAIDHIKLIQEKLEKNEGINWAITIKGDSKLIGIAGHYRISWENFRSEIGYMIAKEHHGKGYISEVVELLIEYGFNDMKMHTLEGVIDPRNFASARVLEKNNFIKEGHFNENVFFEGKFYDSAIYSLKNKS